MDISNHIREYLGTHGVKQVFLADKCGWSKQKTNTIVCGKRKITADELASICDALNLPYGGWPVVEAPDRHLGCAAFRAYHPDKIETLLNCSSVYNEELFRKTAMAAEGNFGARCHEIIHLSRELLTVESEGS